MIVFDPSQLIGLILAKEAYSCAYNSNAAWALSRIGLELYETDELNGLILHNCVKILTLRTPIKWDCIVL